MKNFIVFFNVIIFFGQLSLSAQEFNTKVKIIDTKVQNVDKRVFRNLEQSLTNYLNSKKWTNVNYQEYEKIDCNFIITLTDDYSTNSMYNAVLNVSANRPVYGTTYTSPIVNYSDSKLYFKYIENQVLSFSDLNIDNGSPLEGNLMATIAYYCYLTLGLDYDSYELNGGLSYYLKAQNIVINSPKADGITGWDSDKDRNGRAMLIDNLISPRMKQFHNLWYDYHRKFLDNLHLLKENRYSELNNLVDKSSELYTANAGSPLMEFYFNAKGLEIFNLINSSVNIDKKELGNKMSSINVNNAKLYQSIK